GIKRGAKPGYRAARESRSASGGSARRPAPRTDLPEASLLRPAPARCGLLAVRFTPPTHGGRPDQTLLLRGPPGEELAALPQLDEDGGPVLPRPGEHNADGVPHPPRAARHIDEELFGPRGPSPTKEARLARATPARGTRGLTPTVGALHVPPTYGPDLDQTPGRNG